MKENTKKVATLYRVSTKSQLQKNESINKDGNSDIPTQKRACETFIEGKGDWELVKEYQERGVSGYKVSEADRDVLQQIKRDAESKKFDVLLVFMFDRLGRIANETPFVMEWFVKQGIEMWSVTEGQQKFEDETDTLVNFIRFWQAGGESSKTSKRVNEEHSQMVEDGIYRGGTPAYGYKTIKSNNVNKKGRELLELIIDEEQAKTVRHMYDLVTGEGYGQNRIAKLLNERGVKAQTGKAWSASVVSYILRNPIYKGSLVYNRGKEQEVSSRELVQEWKVVSEAQWSQVQNIRESRRPGNIKREKNHTVIKSTKGPLLFVGAIRCGHCDSPLTTTYRYKTYENRFGEKKSSQAAVYRCSGKALQKKNCTGQTTYSSARIEGPVLEEVYSYLKQLETLDLTKEIQKLKKENSGDDEKKLMSFQRDYRKVKSEYGKLKEKVMETINDENPFYKNMLNEMIGEKVDEITVLEKSIQESTKIVDSKKIELKEMQQLQLHIPDWIEVFEGATNEKKKMMLITIIESIIVMKDNVEVNFKIDFFSFLEKLGSATSQLGRALRWQ